MLPEKRGTIIGVEVRSSRKIIRWNLYVVLDQMRRWGMFLAGMEFVLW